MVVGLKGRLLDHAMFHAVSNRILKNDINSLSLFRVQAE